jgi:XTP/dITP diphosphohydrolase
LLRILLASGNRNKLAEFSDFFKDISAFEAGGVELASLEDVDIGHDGPWDIEELGGSYEENALIKARAWAEYSGMTTIADDSGLEVRKLGWAPGIYSARAVSGSDQDRVSWMLGELGGADDRRARFVACIVVAFPVRALLKGRNYFALHGVCWGGIARAPRGCQGFGYDPVFIPDGFRETFAELGGLKSKISHRATAMKGVAQIVPSMLKYRAMYERMNRLSSGQRGCV